ncbi:hypothetical protein [Aequorivita marina]|uniref:hypothetical protein n=1 Tax=Aequorivita marina TaxID=3073654 RepID=UPI0028769930|nr:hypothetical protein [Aequorivita sp. S2608]MDS1299564.1 hypothetical protein [Aequorivita sp. S2608]
MKKLLIILLFSTLSLQAQQKKHEKIKALKTAYITEKLDLTSSEAEKFWPVYNRFSEKLHTLKVREHKEIYRKLRDGIETLSDAEANKLIDENQSIETSEMELRQQMTDQLRKVISPKKIILLKKAEHDFKRKLLQKYRHGKEKRKS